MRDEEKVEKAYKKANALKLYELKVSGEFADEMRVRIPVSELPEGYVNMKVFYFDQSEELVEIPNEINSGEITFVTDHADKIVVCGVDLHGNSSGENETPKEKSDMFGIALAVFVVLLIAELVIGFILIKKRRTF